MNRNVPLVRVALGLAAVLVWVTSCDELPTEGGSDGGDSAAQIQILLRDSPVEYLDQAWIAIPRVYLVVGDDDPEDGPPLVELFHDADDPHELDLLTLQDGVTADLTGVVEMPEGAYAQLRVVVTDAWVILKDPFEFSDDDGGNERSLAVPSAARSGVKVFLAEPIVVEPGALTVVIIDVDVNENFVLQGSPQTPAGIVGVTFTPVVREVAREVNGG